MNVTGKLTFAEKQKLIKDACQMYRRYGTMIIKKNSDRFSVIELKKHLSEIKNVKFLSIFDQVLNLLSPTSYLIIYNDYINQNSKKDWKDMYFSKTTYYKRKHQAVDEFINCMFGF
ncbi:MG284/MPN403 family protein [Mycoplasma phocimorsus]|uniref:Uncharacterized protein n=1 Tax=Mycoplasma phocimorsus TaxID=3045839 RepID=A0AAJ1PTJ1_9MOLU|nr:hypothetical protein [Mycoplasma phocimorsus]MDJ1645605.1 hypothetical protein [Mycoplasma phocimorsus]MDJ1646117.1 hypothetical protein [Mycoplasma phocimorsus]MDJ1647155.1 hypothetical protein [Mycoplasma phocimorsus]MDJ1647675.1 hypothetical protein [Mycoplasma phocimorsus]MDJ1648227.1 hypothetical protein [Mycoplasma phocimorsus]